MKTNLLINNKSVQGNADAYDVINPFNSEIIAEVIADIVAEITRGIIPELIAVIIIEY